MEEEVNSAIDCNKHFAVLIISKFCIFPRQIRKQKPNINTWITSMGSVLQTKTVLVQGLPRVTLKESSSMEAKHCSKWRMLSASSSSVQTSSRREQLFRSRPGPQQTGRSRCTGGVLRFSCTQEAPGEQRDLPGAGSTHGSCWGGAGVARAMVTAPMGEQSITR